MMQAWRYGIAEILLNAGRSGAWVSVCLFFIIAGTSFPFTLEQTPPPETLRGLIWLLFLISPALCAAAAFRDDAESGRLERALPLYGGVTLFITKWAVCWLLYALPSGLIAPWIAFIAGAPFPDMMQATLLFTVAGILSALLCAFCGALSAGAAGRDTAGAALLMPLYVPIWIFGAAGAADVTRFTDAMTFFSACLLLFAPLCAALGAYLLRESAG